MSNKLFSYINFHSRNFGHFKFKESIVVIESDDWGKHGFGDAGSDFLDNEKRTDWSYDRLETVEEVNALNELLSSYKRNGHESPRFTLNTIVANPNVSSTIESNYEELKLSTIDVSDPKLIEAYKTGMKNEVFLAQYHGRLHYNPELYLESLKSNEVVRTLFENNVSGGLENFKETQLAYYSEYFNFLTNKESLGLANWISTGLREFQNIFGYQSQSTIAPNYVISKKGIEMLSELGVKYLQGSNKLISKKEGKEFYSNYCLGAKGSNGLVHLVRNVKFEPCRSKAEWQSEFCKKSIINLFSNNIPVVLDTHRINYVGENAERSRAELKKILDLTLDQKDVTFLTSVELGEAISNDGVYHDVFTKERKQLTPLDSLLKKAVRTWVK
jgi:hypothetical protein